jgi:nucleoside-diphosphate-sugar epimerase
VLNSFIYGADLVFHCAAELHNVSMMQSTNVKATEALIEACRAVPVKYFCFISSAGVIGLTNTLVVDESTPCNPQDEYEVTKAAAELLVSQNKPGASTVILRPTNVVDRDKPGVFLMAKDGGWANRLKVFIKGGECAHLVHSHDVAAAATFFISHEFENPECFFVSKDDDPLNTIAGVWSTFRVADNNSRSPKSLLCLPHWLPRYLRRICGRNSNSGKVIYSSEKLRGFGFKFSYGVRAMAQELVIKNG